MWAQNWESIFPAVSEFKTKSLDVTDEMLKQNYTVRRMFEISDKFFEDLGLISVNDGAADFYGLSMLERPEDGREVVCHAEGFQGITPPLKRSEEDFDAGSKFHVAAGVPYIRYFVAFILQFDFHQTLCTAAGQFNPSDPAEHLLHNCDINGNLKAGGKLKKLLEAGSSKPWKETLFELTGRREMSVQPLLNYFEKLRDYIQKYLKTNNVPVGWENSL
ncbi:unnamed protein product [Notodromas monacha]|uniref:Angiotensin-converting enzyme n=1 Tax=Notodromas monacha TaxID=399045 RepID=A0A7R9BHA9_9CRUS|nr:unnamed protein product [Notodromas monacha]CAG0914790.1 unnamed protein product [Notodromas monacha]